MSATDSSVDEQRARIAETCRHVAELAARGWRLVVTHGNGPQVGAALLRSELAAPQAYALPLELCVASTQGEMGFLLVEALERAFRERGVRSEIVAVVSRVVVAETDPAFSNPTKPIGRFYDEQEAEELRRKGWALVEEPPRGWRRLAPSPEPLEIPEERIIRRLLQRGATVIALGGGGVPVARSGGRVAGVEAVVDKDLSSALLASALGVQLFLILTDVDGVYLDFGTKHAARLESVTPAELRAHAAAGHFAPGSMAPKVEAVLRFVEAGGARAVVTLPDRIEQSLGGSEGTHVLGGRRWSASAR
jgi:carbamate kinase